MPVAGVGHIHPRAGGLPRQVRTSSVPPPAMASRAFRNRFRKTCCSLPALPCTGGRLGIQVGLDLDAGLLQLVLQQRQRFLDDLFRLTSPNEVVEVREKFSSELTISLARKVCLAILSRMSDFCDVVGHLLGQHLRVGGDHRQRRIHFVRHAGRQQADAAQLVGLHQALLQFGAVGDVVEDDQAADLLLVFGDQRRDGDVQGGLAEARRQRAVRRCRCRCRRPRRAPRA